MKQIMNIKQLLGSQAHWTINKHLSKLVGIFPTILLQHLIDLDENFFKGMESGFYQQQDRLLLDLPMSESQLRNATSELVKRGFITATRKGVPPKYYYCIQYENLYTLINETFKGLKSEPLKVQKLNHKDKELSKDKELKKENNIKNGDERAVDILVKKYPGNVNAINPIIKAFKQLTSEEKKLSIINLERYTKAWQGYYHNLKNYIEAKQFSDIELSKRETKHAGSSINNKQDTKTFKGIY